ncbi:hypothetical protein D3C78_1587570 [compost metagenome]
MRTALGGQVGVAVGDVFLDRFRDRGGRATADKGAVFGLDHRIEGVGLAEEALERGHRIIQRAADGHFADDIGAKIDEEVEKRCRIARIERLGQVFDTLLERFSRIGRIDFEGQFP